MMFLSIASARKGHPKKAKKEKKIHSKRVEKMFFFKFYLKNKITRIDILHDSHRI